MVFVVEGLSLYHFMAYENMFPYITSKLEHRVEIVTPTAYGGSVIEDLAAVPITGIQSDKLIKRIFILKYLFYYIANFSIIEYQTLFS